METRSSDDRAGGSSAGTGLGSAAWLGIGLLVGLLLAVALLWLWRGNPLSSANEVSYREVVVGSVNEGEDGICWAEDPDRRDSPQMCAILALDPELAVPAAGDRVTLGLVELRPPDGSEKLQVVHVAAVEGGTTATDASPTPSASPSPSR